MSGALTPDMLRDFVFQNLALRLSRAEAVAFVRYSDAFNAGTVPVPYMLEQMRLLARTNDYGRALRADLLPLGSTPQRPSHGNSDASSSIGSSAGRSSALSSLSSLKDSSVASSVRQYIHTHIHIHIHISLLFFCSFVLLFFLSALSYAFTFSMSGRNRSM
jgi:hypothetical protein